MTQINTTNTNTFALRDTGHMTVDESGSQVANVVNSGNEVLIFVKNQTFSFSVNVSSNPPAGRTRPDRTALGTYTNELNSSNNPKITLNGYYDISDSTQRTYMKYLEQLSRTYGIKEYYYKNDNAGDHASRKKNIIDVFGETDAQESTYKHLHVRILSLQVPENADTMEKIHYQMVLEVLG